MMITNQALCYLCSQKIRPDRTAPREGRELRHKPCGARSATASSALRELQKGTRSARRSVGRCTPGAAGLSGMRKARAATPPGAWPCACCEPGKLGGHSDRSDRLHRASGERAFASGIVTPQGRARKDAPRSLKKCAEPPAKSRAYAARPRAKLRLDATPWPLARLPRRCCASSLSCDYLLK